MRISQCGKAATNRILEIGWHCSTAACAAVMCRLSQGGGRAVAHRDQHTVRALPEIACSYYRDCKSYQSSNHGRLGSWQKQFCVASSHVPDDYVDKTASSEELARPLLGNVQPDHEEEEAKVGCCLNQAVAPDGRRGDPGRNANLGWLLEAPEPPDPQPPWVPHSSRHGHDRFPFPISPLIANPAEPLGHPLPPRMALFLLVRGAWCVVRDAWCVVRGVVILPSTPSQTQGVPATVRGEGGRLFLRLVFELRAGLAGLVHPFQSCSELRQRHCG